MVLKESSSPEDYIEVNDRKHIMVFNFDFTLWWSAKFRNIPKIPIPYPDHDRSVLQIEMLEQDITF